MVFTLLYRCVFFLWDLFSDWRLCHEYGALNGLFWAKDIFINANKTASPFKCTQIFFSQDKVLFPHSFIDLVCNVISATKNPWILELILVDFSVVCMKYIHHNRRPHIIHNSLWYSRQPWNKQDLNFKKKLLCISNMAHYRLCLLLWHSSLSRIQTDTTLRNT